MNNLSANGAVVPFSGRGRNYGLVNAAKDVGQPARLGASMKAWQPGECRRHFCQPLIIHRSKRWTVQLLILARNGDPTARRFNRPETEMAPSEPTGNASYHQASLYDKGLGVPTYIPLILEARVTYPAPSR
jgi:hypothetical protein